MPDRFSTSYTTTGNADSDREDNTHRWRNLPLYIGSHVLDRPRQCAHVFAITTGQHEAAVALQFEFWLNKNARPPTIAHVVSRNRVRGFKRESFTRRTGNNRHSAHVRTSYGCVVSFVAALFTIHYRINMFALQTPPFRRRRVPGSGSQSLEMYALNSRIVSNEMLVQYHLASQQKNAHTFKKTHRQRFAHI